MKSLFAVVAALCGIGSASALVPLPGDVKVCETPLDERFPDVGKDFCKGWCVTDWGQKDYSFERVEGPTAGRGAMRITLRGLTAGQMQVFSPAWTMWAKSWYRYSFKLRGRGYGGSVSHMVRLVDMPWTAFSAERTIVKVTDEWTEVEGLFCSTKDLGSGFGIIFTMPKVGVIEIADVKVELLGGNVDSLGKAQAKKPVLNDHPFVAGNLLPRGSFESPLDTGFYALSMVTEPGQVWADHRPVRSARGEGLFGEYALVIPATNIFLNLTSDVVEVAPGHAYTFSAWMKTDAPDAKSAPPLSMSVEYRRGFGWASGGKIAGKGSVGTCAKASAKDGWTHVKVTTPVIPPEVTHVFLHIDPTPSKDAAVWLDGVEFAADVPTNRLEKFLPAKPYEFVAAFDAENPKETPPFVTWGEKIPLLLKAVPAADAPRGVALGARLRVTAWPSRITFDDKVTLKTGEETKFALEPNANGILRIELLPDDATKGDTFELIAARLPKVRETGEDSYFGTHCRPDPYHLNYCAALGFKWERLHDCSGMLKMCVGNPKRGVYVWYDGILKAIRARGMNILGVMDMPPVWAFKEVAEANDPTKKAKEYDAEAFRTWCHEAARHYAGVVNHFELWNEPYMRYFFDNDKDHYSKIYRAGARGIREGNPRAKVGGWCTELSSPKYADTVLRETPAAEIPDFLTYHCYVTDVPGDGTMKYAGVLENMKKAFGEKLPKGGIWNTESCGVGGASFHASESDPTKVEDVAYGVRVWTDHAQNGVKLCDYWLGCTDRRGQMYLTYMAPDRTVVPKAVATAVTAYFIDGMKGVGESSLASGVKTSRFEGCGRATVVMWDDVLKEGEPSLDVSRLPSEYVVCDAMGNRHVSGKSAVPYTSLFVMSEKDTAAVIEDNVIRAIGP